MLQTQNTAKMAKSMQKWKRQKSYRLLHKRLHEFLWHMNDKYWMPILQRSRLSIFLKIGTNKKKSWAYLELCWHFSSLNCSVDGLAGIKTWNFKKQLASMLSSKLHQEYNKMTFFVHSYMILMKVRSNTHLLWSSHERRHINMDNFIRLKDGVTPYCVACQVLVTSYAHITLTLRRVSMSCYFLSILPYPHTFLYLCVAK